MEKLIKIILGIVTVALLCYLWQLATYAGITPEAIIAALTNLIH